MVKIQIYTTPYCHFCQLAKEYFKSRGLAWEEYDVMADEVRRDEMVKKSGQLAVPVIDIDGSIIVGFNKPRINELLGVS